MVSERDFFPFPDSPEAPLSRPLVYDENAFKYLIAYHKYLAGKDKYKIKNPYFNFTDQGHPLVFSKELENGVTIKAGPVGAFTTEEMAALTQEQTCIYVVKGAMGEEFRSEEFLKDNPDAVNELTATMMGNFSPSRVVVAFEKKTKKGVKPIIGVQASFGQIDANLLQTMLNNFIKGNPNYTFSSLSTLQALDLNTISLKTLGFLYRYSTMPEKKVVSLGKLFSASINDLKKLGLNNNEEEFKLLKEYPWIAMAVLTIAIDKVAKKYSSLVEYPEICLFDTPPKILNKIEYLGAEENTEINNIQASKEIEDSILSKHYSEESFIGKIIIGHMLQKESLKKAKEYLLEQGIEVEV